MIIQTEYGMFCNGEFKQNTLEVCMDNDTLSCGDNICDSTACYILLRFCGIRAVLNSIVIYWIKYVCTTLTKIDCL